MGSRRFFWPLTPSVWPLTSKEGCDSPRQIKLGLNVNLENSQIIAKCHQLVAQGVWSAHDFAVLIFSLFQALWWLCLLLVRFPPGPGPYASCVCLHFTPPLSSLGGTSGTLCKQTKDGENAGGFSFQSRSEPIPHPHPAMLKWGRPVSYTNVNDVLEAWLSFLPIWPLKQVWWKQTGYTDVFPVL